MVIDVPVTLRLLSHELRTPVGVIQGYMKMLVDGRIDDDARPRVMAQIQQAAGRVAALSQQASDLSHWVSGSAVRDHQDVAVSDLVDDIVRRVPAGIAASVEAEPQAASAVLRAADRAALSDAGAALVAALTRTRSSVKVCARKSGGDVELLIAAGDVKPDGSAPPRPLDLSESGVGLSLVVAAAVVEAHGGRIWQRVDPPVLGMTLPGRHEP